MRTLGSREDRRATLISAVLRYRDDPAAFVREILRADPFPWQEEALGDLVRFRRNAISGCNNAGKDAFAAWAILWYLSTRSFPKIPCTAPSQGQMRDALWAELHKWIRRSRSLGEILEWKCQRIEMRGQGEEWFASQRVAARRVSESGGEKESEGLGGVHAENVLFVLDEASGIDDSAWDTAEASLLEGTGSLLAIGNPLRTSARFYDVFNVPAYRRLWNLRTVGWQDVPRLDRDVVLGLIAVHGMDSPWVRVRLRGLFPLPGSDQNAAIPWALIVEACARELEEEPGEVTQIGVDVARFGKDESSWYVRKGRRIVEWDVEERTPGPHLVGKTIDMWRRHGGEPERRDVVVVVDETGMGGLGLLDPLVEAGVPAVGVNFSSAARDTGRYANRPSEIWIEDLKGWLETASIPDDDVLKRELSCRRWRYTGKDTQKVIESKSEMKARGIRSPSRADALSLSCCREGWEAVALAPPFWGAGKGRWARGTVSRPMSHGLD